MKAELYILILTLLISCSVKEANDYIIVDKSYVSTIYLNKNADELVKWAVRDLINDLEKMTAKKIILIATDTYKPDRRGIYIGSISDKLIENLPETFNNQLQNKWEKYIIKKHGEDLFLVGSDIRGTVYAIFELAERIGISPWKWWADVTPLKTESIILKLPHGAIEEGPSVKYRGIFLNDEDWGLQPWASKTFEPETENIGPKTYEKIFQLLLRLKANTIWPAMHPGTKGFFTVEGNREMAEKYHIIVGTSHAEPMLRNNVDEWENEVDGDFNFFTNSERIKKYWKQRISETKEDDNIITLGMRGIHDSGMAGDATINEKVKLLEKIISVQRNMLTQTLNKPIEEIPQVFTLYKEVLDIYDNGLNIPADVTLMWTDDNYGYIRRLSNKDEQGRSGGSGVYYHLSYWGRPHDYLWLSTTQPGLIWYEMSKAYQNGAKKIWIANVGDIKPGEYNMEFFLDLAWNVNSVQDATIKKHLMGWSCREFGEKSAEEIADVMQEYYRLAFLRKPEFMGWSQTEPTTPTRISGFSTNPFNNEVQRRIDAYAALVQKVNNVKIKIANERRAAYFQLVEYPIKGAALMNYKFLFAQQSYLSTDTIKKKELLERSVKAYKQIIELTTKYNNEICEGKWQGMISMSPRNLPVFALPRYSSSDTTGLYSLSIENTLQTPLAIQAKSFTTAKGSENYRWETIEGLGYSNSSVTLFPLSFHSFTTARPYLEYQFNIEKGGNYKVEIRCIPTHSNNYDQIVSVEINGKNKEAYHINTKGRSESWKENVLSNYVPVIYHTSLKEKESQTLKIYVNQTGIILDQISIRSENIRDYYEIRKDIN